MVGRQVKPGNHLALLSALTHKLRPTAPAQNEAETIEQNGFARSGFPGQYIEPRLKFQLQMVNDQYVTNA